MSKRDLVTHEQLERRFLITDLLERYEASGDEPSVERALRLVEETIPELTLAPELRGHYRRAEARVYELRYRRNGDPGELLRAVSVLETALEELAADSAVRLDVMSNLAMEFWLLYKHRGDLDDLRRAVEIDERVLELTPPESPEYWEAQRNVASDLVRVFTHTRDPFQIERAIQLYEQASAALPVGGSDRARVLDGLANARFLRFQTYGSQIDAFTARQELERAIAAAKIGSEERNRYLGNLGWILLNAYGSSPVPEVPDLDAAVRAFENALAPTSAASPNKALRTRNLAFALVRRFERTGKADDLERAVHLFRESATSPVGGLEVRLEAAILWGRAASRHRTPMEAAEAWNAALEVMRELFALQIRRTDKEAWLWRAEGVPSEAALACVRAHDLEGAAVALDIGRALLLDEALSLRSSAADRLKQEGHADLHARYAGAVERLDAARASSIRHDVPVGGQPSPLRIEDQGLVWQRRSMTTPASRS